MNQKRKFKTDKPNPTYLHEVKVTSGSKTYTLRKGQHISVHRKPGLISGKWALKYAERLADGTLLLTVEGPESRVVSERRVKMIRESDIKRVHLGRRKG